MPSSKVVLIEVAIGADDTARQLETFIADIKAQLLKRPISADLVTVISNYYLVDGTVCTAADYDPETQTRKPGTFPPPWAGGPANKSTASSRSTTPEEQRTEFVQVKPSRTSERNANGRRVRRDKGVKRGPKSTDTAQELETTS